MSVSLVYVLETLRDFARVVAAAPAYWTRARTRRWLSSDHTQPRRSALRLVASWSWVKVDMNVEHIVDGIPLFVKDDPQRDSAT